MIPLQLVLALIFIYNEIGISVLAGLGVLLSIMLFNIFIVRKSQKLNQQLMKLKDKRMNASKEAFI